jgi:predicted enzyme related to lactoylglutathione lyase
MSEREHYPPGVPCWVDTLQADPQAALDFYGPLFGWEFAGPGPMPGQAPGKYFVAQLRGRDVAGIGSAPAADRPPPVAWNTYVRVDSVEHAAERAGAAGGRLLDEPADALPAGPRWSPTPQALSSVSGRPEHAKERSSSTSRGRGR